MRVNKKVCRKTQGVAEPGNTCLTTPGTCESCPDWSKGNKRAIQFTVYGHPEPKGSTRAFIPKGWKRPVITTANAKAKPWHQQVAGTAFEAIKGGIAYPRPTPVCLNLRFYLCRPKSLSKKLLFHTKKPDVDKLVRLVSDALTGIAWEDDSQLSGISAVKCYGLPERVEIYIASFSGIS